MYLSLNKIMSKYGKIIVLILACWNSWTLRKSVGCWTLDAGCYILDAGLWTLGIVVNWFRAELGPSF